MMSSGNAPQRTINQARAAEAEVTALSPAAGQGSALAFAAAMWSLTLLGAAS